MLRRAALSLATLAIASSASAVTLMEWGTGASAWTADFSLNGLLPLARAEAFSSGVAVSADAFAVEGYTYRGGRSGSFTLSIQLDDPAPADLETSVFAPLSVLEEPGIDLPAATADSPRSARQD